MDLRLRSRARESAHRAKTMLRRAFAEEHTTREVAGSFSLGVFITMLPTLGTGFIAFLGLAVVFRRLSKLALVASAVVFNPVVKWGVYAASLGLGFLLLGPVEGVSITDASLNAAPEVVLRLVVGNTILAVVAAVPSYFVAYQVVDHYRETGSSFIGRITSFVSLGDGSGDANPEQTADENP